MIEVEMAFANTPLVDIFRQDQKSQPQGWLFTA